MFVANGQKFILLPETCLHQVLPHTPQHQSYRFFIKHPTSTSTCFTAICGTPELPCAVKTLAPLLAEPLRQWHSSHPAIWHKVCMPFALQVLGEGSKKYLRHEKISHWGKNIYPVYSMYVFWPSVVLAAFWNWNLSPIWFCMALGLESTHSHVSFPFWVHFLRIGAQRCRFQSVCNTLEFERVIFDDWFETYIRFVSGLLTVRLGFI